MNYSFSVTEDVTNENAFDENAPGTLVHIGVGSLALVSYAAREIKDALTAGKTEFSVKLSEVDENENAGKTLLSLTADGDTVETVLSARLRKLRKAEKPTE